MSGGDVLTLTVDLQELDAQRVEDACFGAGALAVVYTDTRDDAILEPAPGEFRLWPKPRLQATFAADVDATLLRPVLAAALNIAPARLQVEWLRDRAWEREWLKDFHATRFGRRLWVCPTHEQVNDLNALVVKLDPGLAFGTGTHPTTALCLEWLDSQAPLSGTIIDYGCGAGILALAALRLGAHQVFCHDIDPQALIATQDNARANDLSARLTIVAGADALPKDADLLLANILSGPLCALAGNFAAHLRAGARVLLAGLLVAQAPVVEKAYAPWFELARVADRDGWVCLAGTRLSRKVAS